MAQSIKSAREGSVSITIVIPKTHRERCEQIAKVEESRGGRWGLNYADVIREFISRGIAAQDAADKALAEQLATGEASSAPKKKARRSR